jgi:hypothetical protein
VSRIFAFNLIRRRLSNAVAELGTRRPCKSLKQRLCCRETLDRNGADTQCCRNGKSIRSRGKDSQKAIFARAIKCIVRMERSAIRDCREASMPSRITPHSIQATLAEHRNHAGDDKGGSIRSLRLGRGGFQRNSGTFSFFGNGGADQLLSGWYFLSTKRLIARRFRLSLAMSFATRRRSLTVLGKGTRVKAYGFLSLRSKSQAGI